MVSLNSVRLSTKLPVIISGLCFLVAITISVTAYLQSRATLLQQAEEHLGVVTVDRTTQIDYWAESVQNDVIGYGTDPTVREALSRFDSTYWVLTDNPTETLQQVYITDNPHPVGERDQLIHPDVATPYHFQHAAFHPFFRTIKDTDNYYDIFLFNSDGDMVYSVYKETDFATNFVDGPYRDTGLGQVFAQALQGQPGQLFVADLAPYAPSNDAPAAFIATPIVTEDGEIDGVFAVQLPYEIFTQILSNPRGLGETGEIIAVGTDGRARSQSRWEDGPQIASQLFEADTILALRESGAASDIPVVTVSDSGDFLQMVYPVQSFGLSWTLISTKQMSEVLAPATNLRNQMILVCIVGLVASALLGWLTARTVTQPLSRLGAAMQGVSERNPDTHVHDTGRGDEIGVLARILVDFRDKLDASDAIEAENKTIQIEQREVMERLNAALNDLAQGDLTKEINTPFAESYEELRNNFNRSVENLRRTIATLVGSSADMRRRADHIANSSDELSQRTENQAATLEETAAALDEITASVKSAATGSKEIEKIVNDAKSDALASEPVVRNAVDAMTEIEKSSDAISKILGVIDDISFQTNLLALNAGVEAARAGDAGKGFAVVASEVRALAQRSSEAAKEIKTLISGSSQQVESGVALVGEAGQVLTKIVEQISHISELMTSIATGSEEQSIGLEEINIGVSQLDQVTQQNAAMVEEANANSRSLKETAGQLSDIVSFFRIDDAEQPLAITDTSKQVEKPDCAPALIDDLPALKEATSGAPIGQPSGNSTNDASIWQDF